MEIAAVKEAQLPLVTGLEVAALKAEGLNTLVTSVNTNITIIATTATIINTCKFIDVNYRRARVDEEIDSHSGIAQLAASACGSDCAFASSMPEKLCKLLSPRAQGC